MTARCEAVSAAVPGAWTYPTSSPAPPDAWRDACAVPGGPAMTAAAPPLADRLADAGHRCPCRGRALRPPSCPAAQPVQVWKGYITTTAGRTHAPPDQLQYVKVPIRWQVNEDRKLPSACACA